MSQVPFCAGGVGVVVPPPVIAALREHRRHQNERRLALGAAWQDNDLVFTSEVGMPIHPGNLTRDFERWVRRAGVPRIRIHDLRHTHITELLQQGANIKAVSEHVGHTRTSITMDLYAHVTPAMRSDVADKIGTAFFTHVEPSVTYP